MEKNYQWTYMTYKRPKLAPPPYIFGLVWPGLYLLMIITYGFVLIQILAGNVPAWVGLPFLINLMANLIYTYFQFKLGDFRLALVDIVIVLVTIIMTMIVIWPYYLWVALWQIPYLLWVGFATYLQIMIYLLNRDR